MLRRQTVLSTRCWYSARASATVNAAVKAAGALAGAVSLTDELPCREPSAPFPMHGLCRATCGSYTYFFCSLAILQPAADSPAAAARRVRSDP